MTKKKTGVISNMLNHLWRYSIDLRQTIREGDQDVFLFLLSAYRDSLLNNLDSSYDLHDQIKDISEKDLFYKEIFPVYASVIKSVPKTALIEIFYGFSQINKKQFTEYFTEIFEGQLQRVNDFSGKRSAQYIQPDEITKIILELAETSEYAEVYNPFAGYASFGISLKENQKYFGQEINNRTWAIGQLRLKAQNITKL